jgi:aminoglycoside phosphotransferase (APT) family kinase protein
LDTTRLELVEVAHQVRSRLPTEIAADAEPFLTGQVPPPPMTGPRCVIHNDLGPDHVLVDPDTGRLTGIVDFSDLMVGDPRIDFVGLVGWGGYGFVREVIRGYPLPLDEHFEDRLAWAARVLNLIWLAEASPGPDTDMHRAWVQRAFEASDEHGARPLR